MSIELHCPRCNKLIRAPDDSGGKTGKCPYCKASVYIPTPSSDDDIIPIAPLDDEEERRIEHERQEASQYIAAVSRGGDKRSTNSGKPPSEPDEDVDVDAQVDLFILAMRDSKLDEAERAVKSLTGAGSRAREHIRNLIRDDMAPAIEDVPPPVVLGFLRNLAERLGGS